MGVLLARDARFSFFVRFTSTTAQFGISHVELIMGEGISKSERSP